METVKLWIECNEQEMAIFELTECPPWVGTLYGTRGRGPT